MSFFAYFPDKSLNKIQNVLVNKNICFFQMAAGQTGRTQLVARATASLATVFRLKFEPAPVLAPVLEEASAPLKILPWPTSTELRLRPRMCPALTSVLLVRRHSVPVLVDVCVSQGYMKYHFVNKVNLG